jgi:predicted amidohydrolase
MELVSILDEDLKADLHKQIQGMQILLPQFVLLYTRLAKEHGKILIAPSFPVEENGKIYNRAFVFGEHGLAGHQDKRFMTRFENEDWNIDAGAAQYTIFEASWGSFGVQICYDLEFAIGSRYLSENGARLIVAPSCTETLHGATRVHVGARARALENQCYVAVSQTVGDALWSAAVDINYGYGGVYSTPDFGFPEEGILSTSDRNIPGWHFETLDFELVDQVRTQGSVLNFRDQKLTETKFSGQEEIKICRVRL